MYLHKSFLMLKKILLEKPTNLCLVRKFNIHEISKHHEPVTSQNDIIQKNLGYLKAKAHKLQRKLDSQNLKLELAEKEISLLRKELSKCNKILNQIIPNDAERPQPKTCWSTKTPFQMGLILVLCVAIPFLIVLIILYIFSLLVGGQSESCSTMCDTLYNWKTHRRGSGPTDYPNYGEPCLSMDDSEETTTTKIANLAAGPTTTRKITTTTTTTTPTTTTEEYEDDDDETTTWHEIPDGYHVKRFALSATAALLEDMYIDDIEQILKCPAVVVSNKWVLCRGNCAKDSNLYIRIGSFYWSKEGIFRDVMKIVYFNDTKIENLALIRFDKNRWITPTIIEPLGNETKGYMVFWKNKLNLPLHQRHKFDIINTVDFEIYQNINCTNFTNNLTCFAASRNSLCENNSNALIFNKFHGFVGFHVETLCPKHYNYSIVVYIDVYQYKSWINSVVNKKK